MEDYDYAAFNKLIFISLQNPPKKNVNRFLFGWIIKRFFFRLQIPFGCLYSFSLILVFPFQLIVEYWWNAKKAYIIFLFILWAVWLLRLIRDDMPWTSFDIKYFLGDSYCPLCSFIILSSCLSSSFIFCRFSCKFTKKN